MVLFLIADLPRKALGQGLSIKVSGNKRTKTEYIKKIVRNCMSQVSSTGLASMAELKQCVINSRLFSEVVIRRERNGFSVDVVEKWTLIPIPLIQVGQDGESKYGFYLLETNFLGSGKILALGGEVSQYGSGYIFYLNNKSINFSNYSFVVAAQKTKGVYKLTEKEDDVTDGFGEDRLKLGFRLGYLYEYYLFRLGVSYQNGQFSVFEEYDRPQDNKIFSLISRIQVDYTDYKLFFERNLKWNLHGVLDIRRDDEVKRVRQFYSEASFGVASFLDHAVVLKHAAGLTVGGQKADVQRIGHKPGFRGIKSQSVWAEKYQATAIDYLVPLFPKSYGTWVAGAFLDNGLIEVRGGQNSHHSYHSYGSGFYLFLKEVAIPGVGIEIGHNSVFQSLFATVTVGLTM